MPVRSQPAFGSSETIFVPRSEAPRSQDWLDGVPSPALPLPSRVGSAGASRGVGELNVAVEAGGSVAWVTGGGACWVLVNVQLMVLPAVTLPLTARSPACQVEPFPSGVNVWPSQLPNATVAPEHVRLLRSQPVFEFSDTIFVPRSAA